MQLSLVFRHRNKLLVQLPMFNKIRRQIDYFTLITSMEQMILFGFTINEHKGMVSGCGGPFFLIFSIIA